MNWGKVWLPHDGFSRDYKTGKSTEEILKALGWTVANREEIAELAVEEGIKASRLTFRQVYMDKDKTPQLQQALKRYRRSINRQTQEPGPPLHDEWSHGADNFRYLCINADRMANEYVYNPPRTSQGSWMGR
jgi:phage terminase large subunit